MNAEGGCRPEAAPPARRVTVVPVERRPAGARAAKAAFAGAWLASSLACNASRPPLPVSAVDPVVPRPSVAPPPLARSPHEREPVLEAQAFRRNGEPVRAITDRMVIAEAEEFQIEKPGWRALPFGTNYFAGTLADCFLSRQAYLGAPEHGGPTVASIDVEVPKTGHYVALVRYEAPYRFETQFRLRIEQGGRQVLDRLYGALGNVKIWPFGAGLKKASPQPWGDGDSIVWEGRDAGVDLEAGTAHLALIADDQPEPAARRNVDVVMLTSDETDVDRRIEKESYLPLDGLLTQAGDVHLRVRNRGGRLKLTVPNGTEHSPYWIHLRSWHPLEQTLSPGESTGWIEVGSLLDTLSDGQWNIGAAGDGPIDFDLELGLRDARGVIDPIRTFEHASGSLALAYFGNTRYRRRIATRLEVVDDVVDYLERRPVGGPTPNRTLVYGFTFDRHDDDPPYSARVREFLSLMGTRALSETRVGDLPRAARPAAGYLDVRDVPTGNLQGYCREHDEDAAGIAVVSLGDEVGLARPPPGDDADFRAWLRDRHIAARDVDPASGGDYGKITYDADRANAAGHAARFYYSNLFAFDYGRRGLRERTAVLHRCFPNAGIGANFSPHREHLYLGATHQWISPFRDGSLTMPWGEDYVFQVPVASPEVNSLAVDMYRAAIRQHPEERIQYYVMPHSPGNTPSDWRRLFYGDIAHGVKIFNLFELRPGQAAYTENHVDAPEMYQAVRTAIHELGEFDDIVQDGRVRPGKAGLWFSETADVWDDHAAPFDAALRALYLMIRHQQIPLDVVVDGDDLGPYQALFLTDAHVSRAGSRAIAAWVKNGGQLVATAGAGAFDELNQPNTVLLEVLGIRPQPVEKDASTVVRLEKEDLPFARVMDHVQGAGGAPSAVIGLRAPFASTSALVTGWFDDRRPAASRHMLGKGSAAYLGFLPGLAYLKPAYPLRPFDRRSDDEAMCHLLPTRVDREALRWVEADVGRFAVASEPLVETAIVDSPDGVLVPIVNWTAGPLRDLRITLAAPSPPNEVTLASGAPVNVARDGPNLIVTMDLAVADALILR